MLELGATLLGQHLNKPNTSSEFENTSFHFAESWTIVANFKSIALTHTLVFLLREHAHKEKKISFFQPAHP